MSKFEKYYSIPTYTCIISKVPNVALFMSFGKFLLLAVDLVVGELMHNILVGRKVANPMKVKNVVYNPHTYTHTHKYAHTLSIRLNTPHTKYALSSLPYISILVSGSSTPW